MIGRTLATILTSLVIGAVITLASGLFRTPLERMGVDVVLNGFPLAWSIRVIPRPIHIVWGSLLADIAFWTLIGLLAASTMAYLGRTRTTRPLISPRNSHQ